MTAPAGKRPAYGLCRECDHIWPLVWLPMPLYEAVMVLKGVACPACGAERAQVEMSFTPSWKRADAVLGEEEA